MRPDPTPLGSKGRLMIIIIIYYIYIYIYNVDKYAFLPSWEGDWPFLLFGCVTLPSLGLGDDPSGRIEQKNERMRKMKKSEKMKEMKK